MPILALLAQLWIRNPQDPEAMLDWPADLVFQMLTYIGLGRKLAALETGGDWSD